MVAGKTGESGDICGRNLKKSTTMEIMTIESNAYRLLVEKIEKITAYVEESRNREETERKRKEEAESPAAKGRKADPKWMTHKESFSRVTCCWGVKQVLLKCTFIRYIKKTTRRFEHC